MSATSVIVSIMIIALMVTGGVLLYYYYEKPKEKEQQLTYTNISLRITNLNGQPLESNYTINVNGLLYNGTTVKDGFVVTKIPTNTSVSIFISYPGYYSYYKDLNFIENPTAIRIEESLVPVGNITVFSETQLNENSKFILNLKSKGIINYLKICFRWTNNIISVSPEGDFLILTEKPKYLEFKVDKCYNLNSNLTNNDWVSVPLRISKYSALSNQDNLQVNVLYGDILYNRTIDFNVKPIEVTVLK